MQLSKAEELVLNGAADGFVLTAQGWQCFESPFSSGEEFLAWLKMFAWHQGTILSPQFPSAGGYLDHLHCRWHAVIPPLSDRLPLFSLRYQHGEHAQTPFPQDSHWYLWLRELLQKPGHLLLVGPTGAGKTTFMSQLLFQECFTERVIIIESVRELPLLAKSWIRLTTQESSAATRLSYSLAGCLTESLRLRPDRLVVGEIRAQAELRVFLAAGQTGHRCSLATFHAGSLEECRERLAQLAHTNRRVKPVEVAVVVLNRRPSEAWQVTEWGYL